MRTAAQIPMCPWKKRDRDTNGEKNHMETDGASKE